MGIFDSPDFEPEFTPEQLEMQARILRGTALAEAETIGLTPAIFHALGFQDPGNRDPVTGALIPLTPEQQLATLPPVERANIRSLLAGERALATRQPTEALRREQEIERGIFGEQRTRLGQGTIDPKTGGFVATSTAGVQAQTGLAQRQALQTEAERQRLFGETQARRAFAADTAQRRFASLLGAPSRHLTQAGLFPGIQKLGVQAGLFSGQQEALSQRNLFGLITKIGTSLIP